MQAITLYPVITEKFFKAHKRLEEGKCKITDVIIGYQGDAEDFAEKKNALSIPAYKQAFWIDFSCSLTLSTRLQIVSTMVVTNFGARRKSDRLKSKHGADNVVVVTKNNGLLIVKPGDIDKLKEDYKVKSC
jgi:hypothetical protein